MKPFVQKQNCTFGGYDPLFKGSRCAKLSGPSQRAGQGWFSRVHNAVLCFLAECYIEHVRSYNWRLAYI